MKRSVKQIVFWLCILSGIGLMFIGIRFYLDPLAATTDYGINTSTNGDFSFQHIKGVRDFFFGIIILVLLWKKQWHALGWILLLGTIIPAADFCIVISRPDYIPAQTLAHLIAVVICVSCGTYYLKNQTSNL